MPRLVIFDDSLRGIDLPRQPIIIGRSLKSDIPIRDPLLSRKHCALFPTARGFRLVDLKSSHGTFLNGSRIDRTDLSFDDVIEVGDTVMVYLDTEVWNRGEGLTKLRNPVKAQELVQRLNLHSRRRERIPAGRVEVRDPLSERSRQLLDFLPVLIEGGETGHDSRQVEELLDLLVGYASYKTVSLWIRKRPEFKRAITEAVQSALLSSLPGTWAEYRTHLREEIRRRILEPCGAAPTAGDSPAGSEPRLDAPPADRPGGAGGAPGGGNDEADHGVAGGPEPADNTGEASAAPPDGVGLDGGTKEAT